MHASKNVNTCSKCLLPASFPNADIDQNHLCSFCREYKPFISKGEDELQKQLASRHGETYDVVVPVSGGKDSTYILWYAKKVLQLRIIAVNYDSGLQSDLSKENIRNACDCLEVPLVVKTVNYKRQIAMVHSTLRIAEAVNGYFDVCGNCENGIRSSAVSVALDYVFLLFSMGTTLFLYQTMPPRSLVHIDYFQNSRRIRRQSLESLITCSPIWYVPLCSSVKWDSPCVNLLKRIFSFIRLWMLHGPQTRSKRSIFISLFRGILTNR